MAETRKVIRSVTPLSEQNSVYNFSHKSIQEMLVAKSVGDNLVAALKKTGMQPSQMKAYLKGLLNLQKPILQAPTINTLTLLLVGQDSTASTSKARFIAQALIQYLDDLSQCSAEILDLSEEDAVRDFLVDRLIYDMEVLQAVEVAALISHTQLGSGLDTLRLNCLSFCRGANPRRQGGTLLHVAAREGAVAVLEVALGVLSQEDGGMTQALCGDSARDNGPLTAVTPRTCERATVISMAANVFGQGF
jgi:hypothetical protein